MGRDGLRGPHQQCVVPAFVPHRSRSSRCQRGGERGPAVGGARPREPAAVSRGTRRVHVARRAPGSEGTSSQRSVCWRSRPTLRSPSTSSPGPTSWTWSPAWPTGPSLSTPTSEGRYVGRRQPPLTRGDGAEREGPDPDRKEPPPTLRGGRAVNVSRPEVCETGGSFTRRRGTLLGLKPGGGRPHLGRGRRAARRPGGRRGWRGAGSSGLPFRARHGHLVRLRRARDRRSLPGSPDGCDEPGVK